MSKIIGMSRNINLDWLDKVADLVEQGKQEDEIKEILNDYISLSINSPTNLRKTREILMNIWVRIPEESFYIRELALELYNSNKATNKLVAHWCMILLAYPVFGDIVSVIGKMSDKQYDITTTQVKNRMFDVWGERSTLYHSIDKNIRTLKELGVLANVKTGLYKINKVKIDDDRALVLIVLIMIYRRDKLYLKVDDLDNSAEFFPFEYKVYLEVLEVSNLFNFDKFGGEIVVSLNDK